jgi:hypothetical protein
LLIETTERTKAVEISPIDQTAIQLELFNCAFLYPAAAATPAPIRHERYVLAVAAALLKVMHDAADK